MYIKTKFLKTKKQAIDYENFILSIKTSLLYASLKYRNFLQQVLDNSKPFYLLTYEGNAIVGALPVFIKYNEKFGNVLNSLPFFGSNGGIIISKKIRNKNLVQHALFKAFSSLAAKNRVVSSTVISSPFDATKQFYKRKITFFDKRIGQLTSLPVYSKDPDLLKSNLLAMFHKKTRNAIRKAIKSGVSVSDTDSIDAVRVLANMHKKNINALGGVVKTWKIFKAIRKNFSYGHDYRVYIAKKDEKIIAALLVFFFNRTAEYYIPASLSEARILQPMSLIIFEAMQEASRRGCKWWNWGGTRFSQEKLYHFKKRWNTQDKIYFYHTNIYDESILNYDKQMILKKYQYFYVVPFEKLKVKTYECNS